VVLRLIDTARRARLDVVGLHAEPLALLKAFGHYYRRQDDQERTTCFIDIGAATTKAVIAHGTEMVFAKTIHAAGDHFTRHRAKRDGISFTEARAARMGEQTAAGSEKMDEAPSAAPVRGAPASGGMVVIEAQMAAERATATAALAPLPERKQAFSPAPGLATARTASPAGATADEDLGDTLDCLVDELQLCVRYHQGMFAGRPIERLVFLGGEAHHVNVCQKIARSLRITAQLGDPLARLSRRGHSTPPVGVDFRRPQPNWAVPLGLCLSEPNL
jgi:Tfp pilus assembly PilM family ATPase